MVDANFSQDELKRIAAVKAVDEVEDGTVLGLGSGSTMDFVLEALATRVANGLRISGIPTSVKSADMAKRLGIPLTSFSEHLNIDLTIDGADEVDRNTLNLIKGRGGALLREKNVANASSRVIIVVDESKLVDRLGSGAPLPIEIVSFGWQTTLDRLRSFGLMPALRKRADKPFVTDGGNYIVDCAIASIPDPVTLEKSLAAVIGVVESGLFITLASKIIVGGQVGVSFFEKGLPVRQNPGSLRDL